MAYLPKDQHIGKKLYVNIDPQYCKSTTTVTITNFHERTLKNPNGTKKMDLFIVVPINPNCFLGNLETLGGMERSTIIKNFDPYKMMANILKTGDATYLALFDNKKNAQARIDILGNQFEFDYEDTYISRNVHDLSDILFNNKHLPYGFIIYCVESSPEELRSLLRKNDFEKIKEYTKYSMWPKRIDTEDKTKQQCMRDNSIIFDNHDPNNLSFLYPALTQKNPSDDTKWVYCKHIPHYYNQHLVLLINLSYLYDNNDFDKEPKKVDKSFWAQYTNLREGFKILPCELIFKIQKFLGGDIPRKPDENLAIIKSIFQKRNKIHNTLEVKKSLKRITFFVNQESCDIKIEKNETKCTIS